MLRNNPTNRDLDLMLDLFELLENFLEVKIEVFSFHNTTPFTMSCQNYKYGGLINTYSSYFQEKNISKK